MKDLIEIVILSCYVTLSATLISSFISIPLSFFFYLKRKNIIVISIIKIINVCVAFPPVLMGLIVYLFFFRKGPLGFLHLLYTPTIIIIAQIFLIIPIIITLSFNYLEKHSQNIINNIKAIGIKDNKKILLLLIKEKKNQFLTFITLGIARGISEVGAVMIVGGNIDGKTRVITTYIATETGKGNFKEAMILGFILFIIIFCINLFIDCIKGKY